MTHWKDIPEVPVPSETDSWYRPAYDQIAALSRDELVSLAWNASQTVSDLEMQALDLAQDLSCEFELCDYTTVKPEFRHEESVRRQERGIGYMRHAYALAGFTDQSRAAIGQIVQQFVSRRFGAADE